MAAVAVKGLNDAHKAFCVKYLNVQPEAADEVYGAALLNGVRSGAVTAAELVELNQGRPVERAQPSKGADPAKAFSGNGGGAGNIRVKGSSEAYSNVKAT